MLNEAASPEMSDEPTSLAERRAAAIEGSFLADEDGLRAAFDAYGGLVHSYCSRTLGPHRAQDATQEVFVSAWRNRARFDPGRGPLVAWLLGIARYRVLGMLRSEGRHPDPHGSLGDLRGEAAGAEAELIADRLLVAEALARLPERVRAAIELAYFEGLSQQEVSDRLAVPLGTVKSDIRRGLLRLRDALGADRD